jgi:hypothetical protein
MKNLSRANALKLAAVISFLLGIGGVMLAVPELTRGADVLDDTADSAPFAVIIIAFVFAVMRITAAPGLWQSQRWGIVLTLIANALDALAAAPGILFGPTLALKAAASSGVVLSLVVIVLCLWRDPPRTLA